MGESKHPRRDTYWCLEDHPLLTVDEDCTAGILIQCPNALNQSVLCVETSEDQPTACMPHSVKRLFKVYEVTKQVALM